MKLEVGMYVRFKDKRGNTYIRKIVKLADEYPQKLYGMEIDVEANYSEYLSPRNVYKASHSIIDLIQVGDYVNGLKVMKVKEHLHNDVEIVLSNGEFQWSFSKNESDYKIKSIVTKEQFESMSYKVED